MKTISLDPETLEFAAALCDVVGERHHDVAQAYVGGGHGETLIHTEQSNTEAGAKECAEVIRATAARGQLLDIPEEGAEYFWEFLRQRRSPPQDEITWKQLPAGGRAQFRDHLKTLIANCFKDTEMLAHYLRAQGYTVTRPQ